MPKKTVSDNQSRPLTRNYILNNLPKEDFERLSPELEFLDMPHGKVLYRPEQLIDYVYFPNTSMVSIVNMTQQGQSVEAGTIGWEGMAGFNVLMGVDSMPNENVVQLSGDGLRMSTQVIKQEFQKNGAFKDLILHFIHALMVQMGQTSLCNRLHSNEERLSRWLLISHDRAASDELELTQEFLGVMLGSNRATVTLSAIALQSAGFIKYSRGRIKIIDRKGLENFTCDCYQAVKNEYNRMQKK